MAEELRSADVLVSKALADPDLLERIKSNPHAELPKLAQEAIHEVPVPLRTDKWIYRVVVLSLGLTVLSVVTGTIFLTYMRCGEKIPDLLTAIGSAAVGAMAGLLAPSPVPQK